MSLDVSLYEPNPEYAEWAKRKEASLAEARKLKGLVSLVEEHYQDRMPPEHLTLYSANITHNLGRMAEVAGIYKHLWRPEEIEIKYAEDLIGELTRGLADLKSKPELYKQFNAKNGWGLYEHFVPFVEQYLNACIQYPKSLVHASR